MAGKVIGKTFDYGFAGQVSRSIDDIVEALPNLGSAAIAFGAPVVLSGDGVRAFAGGDTAGQVIGFATRYTKTNDTYGEDDAKCNPGEMVSVLKRGTMTVKVLDGTPAKGGKVYLTAGGAVSAAATGNTALTNMVFASGMDGNGIAEITILTRVL